MYDSTTVLEVVGHRTVFRSGMYIYHSTPPYAGLQFVPFYVPCPDHGYDCIMTLMPLSNGVGSVGASENEMGSVYSNSYYTSGTNLGIVSASDARLIPYLVKAIQEQNERIETLEQQVSTIQTGAFVDEFDIDLPNRAPQQKTQSANGTENHVLHQNIPNPFNAATTINYKLAEDVTSAKICIYNLAGKQLQCHELPAAQGANTIEVRASSLQAGMYLYSLIVGNQLVDTKRMVLTE